MKATKGKKAKFLALAEKLGEKSTIACRRYNDAMDRLLEIAKSGRDVKKQKQIANLRLKEFERQSNEVRKAALMFDKANG